MDYWKESGRKKSEATYLIDGRGGKKSPIVARGRGPGGRAPRRKKAKRQTSCSDDQELFECE